MKNRCMMCGRIFEVEEINSDPYDDYDEEEEPNKKRSASFCLLCEAKIRHDSDRSKKETKPM